MHEYLSENDYFIGVNQITERLDKIISLLELRNSISQARNELVVGEYSTDPFVPDCTCHKKGQTSAVEYCQLHDKLYEGGIKNENKK